MRGDADPAAAVGPLKTGAALRVAARVGRAVWAPAAGRAALATGLLLLLVLLSGGARSPLLPLLAAAVATLIRYVDRPAVLLVPPPLATTLLLAASVAGSVDGGAVLAAVALLLSAVPGLLWRREVRRAAVAAAPAVPTVTAVPAGVPLDSEAEEAAADQADLSLALRAIAERLGARAVIVWHADGWQGTASPRASSGRLPPRIRMSGDPLGWAWEQGMRLRIDRAPRWAEQGSLVFADRLRRHGEYGELVTYAFAPGAEPDPTSLDQTAVYLRGVIALREATAAASSARRRLLSLAGGLRAIPGTLQLDSLANGLCVTAISITEATGAAVGTWDGERGEVLGVVGSDGGPRAGDAFAAPDSELALALLAGTMIVRQADDWSLGRTSVAHDGERWDARPRAMAALPLRSAGGAVGVLAVWTSSAPALDPAGLELLHALSSYAAMHLEHARSYGQIRDTAERDPLTHLRNRRAFDAIFTAERMRFERYGRPVSLLIADLDHFKRINDTWGHEAGDEVLRRMAGLLTASIRDVDTAARFGGEEFVVLLPETPLRAAMEVAERIREAVAETKVPWAQDMIPLSVSIGVSCCPSTAAEPGELIATADAALYRAKAEGRNRTVAAASV